MADLTRRLVGIGFIAVMNLAQADPCDELPKPAVTVKRIESTVAIKTTYTYRSLNNLGGALNRPNHQILGLTRGNGAARFELKLLALSDQSGRWECASPQITLTYGFAPLTVYVAREFPSGSCAYKEIHEHEQRHVKTYQDHAAAIEAGLIKTLTDRFAGTQPWRGAPGETAA